MMERQTILNVTTVTQGHNISSNESIGPTKVEMQLRLAITICTSILGIGSIVLNLLFLLAARYLQDNATPYHRFLKNLSIADIMASFTFLLTVNWPQGAIGDINTQRESYFLGLLPYIMRSTPWMFFTAYLLTLLCLSVNQYVAVCQPWKYSEIVTRKAVISSLVIVWLVSSLQVLVPLVIVAAFSIDGNKNQAVLAFYNVSRIEILVWMATFALVTIINIFLNIRTSHKIKKLKQKFAPDNCAESGNIRVKHKAFVTICLLLVTSIVCRLPFPLVGVISIASNDHIVNAVLSLLLFGNFFVDPIIYIIRMSEVRRCHQTMFLSCCRIWMKEPCQNTENQRPSEMKLLSRPEASVMITDVEAVRRASEWAAC